MADNTVSLVLDGQAFKGWTAVRVMRSMEAVAGAFEISLTNAFQLEDKPMTMTPGRACVLRLGDDTIITGYIDAVQLFGGTRQSEMRITGRDRSADLVDCSVIECPSAIKNETIARICERIAAPYGIKVSIDSDIAVTLDKFSLEPYEDAFEAIARVCRLAGVMPVSDRAGGILLTRSGRSYMATDLVWGQNIIQYSAVYSMADRYQTYTVYAQRPGSDKSDAKAISQIQATASDLSVGRARTKIMHAGDAIDYNTALRRARWEATTRALGVSVQGAGGKMRSTEDIFMDVTDAMNKISDPITKNRVALELFGREGAAMTLMMEGGTDQLQKFRNEARRLGVITTEDAARAETFNDALERMQRGFFRLRDTVGLRMLPALTLLSDRLTETFIAKQPAIEAFAVKLAENLPAVIDKLTEGFAAISKAVVPFGKFAAGLADYLGPANLVLGAMAFIVGTKLVAAFAGLTTALRVLNLAFVGSPVGMMLLGIGGAGVALVATIRHFRSLNAELKETDRLNKLLGAGPEVKTTDENRSAAVGALNAIYTRSFQNPGQWGAADDEALKRAEERARGYGIDLPENFADRVKMINDMASSGPGSFVWPGQAVRNAAQGGAAAAAQKVDIKIGFDRQAPDQPQVRPRVNGQPIDPRRGYTLAFD
jgi:prophage tail gpP-like protein